MRKCWPIFQNGNDVACVCVCVCVYTCMCALVNRVPGARIYNGKKTTSLRNCVGKTGQPLVKE